MKILVTGGAGYIGSHTVLELIKQNHEVAVFDSLELGHKESLEIIEKITGKEIKLYQGDLLKLDEICNAIKDFQPDSVIHFAAYALVGESVKNPLKYYRNNVMGGVNLLDAMLQNNVFHIVFSSTCAIFGEPEIVPISEDLPKNPINSYGASKLTFERVLKDTADASDLRFVALRYFNACGAEINGKIGEDHTCETHLIPLIMDTALGRRESIAVFGTNYDTKDGTCVRDYIHVLDLADAHIKALEYLKKENVSNTFNLGTTNGYSVKEIIQSIKDITGKDFKVIESERRAGDPAKLIADNSKVKKILGWQPKYDLKQIIESAWKWECEKGCYDF